MNKKDLTKDIINNETYSKKDVADMLHVQPRTIDNYIASGDLQVTKLGRKVLISKSALEEFIEKRTK